MDFLFFGHNDPLFSSTAPMSSLTSDVWASSELDIMPTPPVSPSHSDNETVTKPESMEEDLDLGLGELGLDLPQGLMLDELESDSWLNEIFQVDATVPDVLDATKCEVVNELRHDCMWAGHCPAEEHRGKKDQLPILSSSPPESTVLSMSTLPIPAQRTRLDTLGSIRPETPLSLSDSELDADQLTSDDGANNNKNGNSSSSSADESESDEERSPSIYQPTLPPNIHPVRNSSQIRKINSKSLVNKMALASSDHSYSHSDHSYHTQRRPIGSDMPFDLGAPTPSDSEEEIDVVSLGEVLRMNPSGTVTTSKSPASASIGHHPATAGPVSHAPLRLKLKVAPAAAVTTSSGQVLMRKALPSHPSALVRQQLQLAVATAAQQRKQSDNNTKKSTGDAKLSSKVIKRQRSSGESSPRKRSSRAASDSEDSCEKRSQHNSMERQRRVDLRNAFEFLRSLIPDLEATDRAAKVVILKKAANFCQGLTQREKQYVADKDALQKRQEMLRKRLALLQRRR